MTKITQKGQHKVNDGSKPVRKGITLSDIHLGQAGARGTREMDRAIDEVEMGETELVVLNGDIIEGKDNYGKPEDVQKRFDHGVSKVRELCQAMQDAKGEDGKVVYVFGNHDATHEIRDAIGQLAEEFPNVLQVEDVMYKQGNVIFTHGDLPLGLDHYSSGDHAGVELKDLVKAVVRGQLEYQPLPLSREMRPDQVGEPEEGQWKEMGGADRRKGNIKRIQTGIGNAIDTHVAQTFSPLPDVLRLVDKCFVEHDRNQPEGEKVLEGVDTYVIGHIHPPAGQTRHFDAGKELIVTGSSTRLSAPQIYEFELDDNGGVSNFTTLPHNRHYDKPNHPKGRFIHNIVDERREEVAKRRAGQNADAEASRPADGGQTLG